MQKKVLIVVGAVVLGMLLFPPFQWEGKTGSSVGAGYSFLFNPPDSAVVDALTLFTQWAGVLIIGGIGFFLTKDD